ncbi:MAG: sortase [Candidatus Doudnabacteria bacterium]|nr:sortase [Candidatus Doudnabacteria bacterium]
MQEIKAKKSYPAASDTVAVMLGLNGGKQEEEQTQEIKPLETQKAILGIQDEAQRANLKSPSLGRRANAEIKANINIKVDKSRFLRAILPYFMVFGIGLVAYYFFFSGIGLNLSEIFKIHLNQTQAPKTVKDTALMVLQKDPQTLEAYYLWISQFYFEVSDRTVLDPNADNSGNGLTNFQKFLLNLNPKSYDTLSLGMADSQAIALNINPLTGGQLTEGQRPIVEKYFDLEIINNRLAVEQLQRSGLVAGSEIKAQTYSSFGNFGRREAARSGNFKFASPKNSQNLVSRYDSQITPAVNSEDFNLNAPGRLEIPALSVNAPIIFTADPRNFEKDLQAGVVHYPGTALPGQIGTAYISGHSSNYIWAKGDYNKVFSRLGDLPDNSSFIITVVQKQGKEARFYYVVTHRREFSPTNQEQFRNTGESVAALSTCWPVGSTKSRMVVFGKLTQVEK